MMHYLFYTGKRVLALLSLLLGLVLFTPSTNSTTAIAAIPAASSTALPTITGIQARYTPPFFLHEFTASSRLPLAITTGNQQVARVSVNKGELKRAARMQNSTNRRKVQRKPSQFAGSAGTLNQNTGAINKGALKKAARMQNNAKSKMSERQLKASKVAPSQKIKLKTLETQPKTKQSQPKAKKTQLKVQQSQPKAKAVAQPLKKPIQKVENIQESTPNANTASLQNSEARILKINKLFGK